MSKKKYIIKWLDISLFVLCFMVVVGGVTRLTDSGLSITDWKPIMGAIPPLSLSEWEESFDKYKKYPEYKMYNSSMSLEDYKSIFLWEYLHRMLGRIIGLLFIIPFSFFCFKKYLDKEYMKKFLLLLLLGIMQAFMGWYMVKSGLVDSPDISHFRLALHLLLAFIIIAYTYKIRLFLAYDKKNKINNYTYYNIFVNVILLIFFVQVVYGAFSAAVKAGHFWNTYPFINGYYIPPESFKMKPFWLNLLYDDKSFQLIHRNLGILLVGVISFFCYQIKENVNKINFQIIQYFMLTICCQFILGVLTLISKTGLILALFHQFLALILLLLIIKVKHSLRYSIDV